VLNRARAEIGAPGSVENPLGSNSGTKYHAWYGGVQGYQWCAIFQSWLFWDFLHYKSYYTGDWINYGTRNGWMILAPQPGAICVMDRYPYLEQGGISDHVGVIESINGAARTMTLVEGNYNDRVARVTRSIDGSTKYYFIMPPYSPVQLQPQPKQQEEEMFSPAIPMPKEGALNVWSIPDAFGKLAFLAEARPFFVVHNPSVNPVKVLVWVTKDDTTTVGDPTFVVDLPKWSRKSVSLSNYLGTGGGSLTVKSEGIVASQVTTFAKYA
jgi:hypothetical protein